MSCTTKISFEPSERWRTVMELASKVCLYRKLGTQTIVAARPCLNSVNVHASLVPVCASAKTST